MISKTEYTNEINQRKGIKVEPVKLSLLERIQLQKEQSGEIQRESANNTPTSPAVKQPMRTAAERYRRKIDLDDSLYEPSHRADKVMESHDIAQKSVNLSEFDPGLGRVANFLINPQQSNIKSIDYGAPHSTKSRVFKTAFQSKQATSDAPTSSRFLKTSATPRRPKFLEQLTSSVHSSFKAPDSMNISCDYQKIKSKVKAPLPIQSPSHQSQSKKSPFSQPPLNRKRVSNKVSFLSQSGELPDQLKVPSLVPKSENQHVKQLCKIVSSTTSQRSEITKTLDRLVHQ